MTYLPLQLKAQSPEHLITTVEIDRFIWWYWINCARYTR